MRTGVLSDEYILKHCNEYNPVPLGIVTKVLTLPKQTTAPTMQIKRPKYAQPPSRPASFSIMSNAIARGMDPINPAPIRAKLNAQYDREVAEETVELEPQPPPLPTRLTVDQRNRAVALQDPRVAALLAQQPHQRLTRMQALQNEAMAEMEEEENQYDEEGVATGGYESYP